MKCDTITCTKKAVFRAERVDRTGQKFFCAGCLALKIGKYELKVWRTK